MKNLKCPAHGEIMTEYTGKMSHEALFCGTWYVCPVPKCACSILVPSDALKAQLEAQKRIKCPPSAMFRISYIDNHGRISHKGGFPSDKTAFDWVRQQGNSITPLKLLVWSEEIQCFSTVYKF